MAIRVALRHCTQYHYDRTVGMSPHVIRLRPAPHCRTPIESFSLHVEPKPHFINWQQDAFGNYLARVVFPEQVRYFKAEVEVVADLVTINPFDFFLEPQAENFPVEYGAADLKDLEAYRTPAPAGDRFSALVALMRSKYALDERRMVDVLVDINQHLQSTLRYDIRMEPGVFTPEETLTRGHGSCRDFAWLQVNLLRTLGMAARFVSGYSIQLVADQKPLEGPSGVDIDCTDLHAWAEVFLPGAGWVGLDATSGLLCGEGHIPLACTADPISAAPITGSIDFEPRHEGDEVECKFEVEMKVSRLEDRPRPTKSYTDEQWSAILRAGSEVEAILTDNDVRLTMGGEPTFVSIDDMESPEWNTAALGPSKAKLACQLSRRLRNRFAPGGFLMHGQGKWYPGEPLPRWAYTVYFRKDGQPIWSDISLISDGSNVGSNEVSAQRFIAELISLLGITKDTLMPAYEDTFYYLWRERRLPGNVDPFDSKLEDPLERARLQRIFEQGLPTIVGYSVPLRDISCASGDVAWETGRWFLRSERLYLLPGDSPMGFRLPLDSLPWAVEGDVVPIIATDPFGEELPLTGKNLWSTVGDALSSVGRSPHGEELPLLPTKPQSTGPVTLHQDRRKPYDPSTQPRPAPFESAKDIVRTALCVEPRDGVLYVFLPPLSSANAFLDLVGKLEHVAEKLGQTIRVEGYPPPHHSQIQRLSVTPDPGVIEVNIHPAGSWDELVHNTTVLYEEARLTRLGTDKFMVDGRHTGTGGGNHIVLGGATSPDSPFIRRPDVLMSLIGFFHNHPSLSYLFSGLFLGPTSQAPRIDEARNDSVYELEIARNVLSNAGVSPPPWLVDRALRHLLVDVAGNTHRSEFCIDKLYSPDGPTGRLGLVELRAFEMPPDARMSLAQQLLVRAMVARFWKQPYSRPLVRWGTTLHDRFALPFFVWQDLEDSLLELCDLGVKFDPAWFSPHWEFRFPRLGKMADLGIELELRQAIEPWHVLGEEPAGGATARYVDSSVERIQVLVSGMNDPRHRIAVSGHELPLSPTGRSGEYVAAVRYKAWQPPSSLHPTIPAHTPIVVELFDTWSSRVVGGCTYHVAHPGGRSFDTYPTNGLEAESRRMARFQAFRASPRRDWLIPSERSLEHPLTLDLRRKVI